LRKIEKALSTANLIETLIRAMKMSISIECHLIDEPANAEWEILTAKCLFDAICGDYVWTIQMIFEPRAIETLIGKTVRIQWGDAKETQQRIGIITKVQIALSKNSTSSRSLHTVHIKSPWTLTHFDIQNRIFVNQTPQEIIEQALSTIEWKYIQKCIRLTKTYQPLPWHVQYECSTHNFLQRLLVQQDLSFQWAFKNHQFYWILTDTPLQYETQHRIIAYLQNHRMETETYFLFEMHQHVKKENEFSWTAQSNVFYLAPGTLLQVENHENICPKKMFRVIEISHDFSRDITGHTSYKNTFTLVEANVHFQLPKTGEWSGYDSYPKQKTFNGVWIAHIEAPTNHVGPWIDEDGKYRLRLSFDTSQRASAEASHPIALCQPNGGKAQSEYTQGIHFPLLPGTRVGVRCLNGDVDNPYIAGVFPDTDQQSKMSSTTHVLTTAQQHTLVMEDDAQKSHFAIHTKAFAQSLVLKNSGEAKGITLSSLEGYGNISAAGKLIFDTKNALTKKSVNHRETTEGSATAKTEGALKIHSGKNIHCHSDANVVLDSTKNSINISSHANIHWQCANHYQVMSKETLHFNARSKNISIHAGNQITLSCETNLFLTSKGGAIHMANGVTKITGKAIILEAEKIHIKNKEVQYG